MDPDRRHQSWTAAVASARNDGASPDLAGVEEREYFEQIRTAAAADADREWLFEES